jgi:putative phage-type endonuclease
MLKMIEQKSDEWFAERCGKFTGSRFNDLLAISKSTGKPLKARNDLIWQIAAERIQGYQPQGASSYSLQWGVDNEPLARTAYEIKTGEFVEEIGFIKHAKYDFVGVSPDGLIGEYGLLEIKCPKSPEIHLQRFLNGVPDEYKAQIQGQLWVTGRKWLDFVSFDGDTTDKFKLLIIRVERDNDFIENLENEVLKANHEVIAIMASLEASLK